MKKLIKEFVPTVVILANAFAGVLATAYLTTLLIGA